MRLVIIACEIMHREISYCIARSKNIVDARFLKKGLHDIGQIGMSQAIREEIDSVPEDEYEAILVGYGLCSNGIVGLSSKKVPLVVPRAHDCITLLLGSKEKYQKYFKTHPGTYFRSTGWLERNTAEIGPDGKPLSVMTQLGLNRSYDELVAKYGEDNARYIMETMEGWGGKNYYDTLAYIDMDIGPFPDQERQAKEEAKAEDWQYEELRGDIGLLRRQMDGEWDPEEFLIAQPGQKLAPTYRDDIIGVEEQ